jgi:hypothetical protein
VTACQDHAMTGGDRTEPRKQLRVGHVSERAGVNAVRTVLETHGLVVVEVDGRSDYGRDLIVDITEDDEITGSVIGVQVKNDRRFIRNSDWELAATDKDIGYWAESSVPVVGILRCPDSGELRWINLTAIARTDPKISTWPRRRLHSKKSTAHVIPFPSSQMLSDETFPRMIDQMVAYVRQTSAPALLGLFDSDDERRCRAVFDCWTLGRTDARAFLLLRRALLGLKGESLGRAIFFLSHLTPHPDILWRAENWVPPEIERQVRPAFRWSAQEICDLVCAVEHFYEDGADWQRGGLGQCLWMLLASDPDLPSSVPAAMALAAEKNDVDAAFRLLVIHQYLADDPLSAAKAALERYPILHSHFYGDELIQMITDFGRIDLY